MSSSGRVSTAARWALVAVVLVLLVVPGRLLAADHDQDDALVPYADLSDSGTRAGQVPTGQTWRTDAGVLAVRERRLQVVEVRPRVAVDTARAVIAVQVCRPAGDSGCTPTDLPTRGAVRLAPGAARLVLTVTPRQAGEVRIDGFDVTYVDAGRRGTEHAGLALRLTAV